MNTGFLVAAGMAAIIGLPAIAHAQASQQSADTKSPHTVTPNLGAVSQYIFRGLTQTNGKPAIQGGLDYVHSSGLYAGTWLSNISWFTDQNAGIRSAPVSLASPGAAGAPYVANQSNATSLEWDFYGGYKNTFANDWNYDVGAIRYYYPGTYDNVGAYRNPGTTEIYAALGYRWITLKYSKAISTFTFGVNESKGASYIDLSASVPISDSGFTLLAHVGRANLPGNPNIGYWGASGGNNNFFDYTDYKLSVTKDFRGYTFGVAWTHANTKDAAPDGETTTYLNAFGKNIGRSRLTASVSKVF